MTVVVDSAAQAWALRRQVAEAIAPGSGLANVRAMTMLELLSGLAEGLGLTGPASTDPLLEAAVVEALLRAEIGPLSASADHPETASSSGRPAEVCGTRRAHRQGCSRGGARSGLL
ncbi:MAG: hypothetical protein ACKOE2_17260 [Actinomycetales bacterium]